MPIASFDPSRYDWNACAAPLLVTAAAMLLLGATVMVRGRGAREARHFTWLAAAICIWLFCFSFMYLAADERVALAWAKAAYLGITFIPAALYHFTLAVTRSERRRWAWAGWAASALFCAPAVASDALLRDLYHYWWGFYPRFRWLGAPFLAYFFAMLALVLRELWSDFRRSEPGTTRRVRTRMLMIGVAIAYLGSCDFVAAYGVPLYPFGYLPVLAFIVIVAHAIRRHRLVDLTPAFAAEQILATAADPVIVCDREGRIRFTNQAAANVFGYSGGELSGAPLACLEEPPAGLTERLRAAAALVVRDEEMVFCDRAGGRVEVRVSLSPLLDERRTPVGVVLIARDVRARKRVEAALRESEERYRLLFERNQAGVFRTSVAGVILDCNDAFARILGFAARGECIGKSMLHHYKDLWERTELLQKMRTLGGLADEEVALQRIDGSPAWVLANATLLTSGEGAVEVLEGTVIDITQRKNAERTIVYQAYHDALTGLPNRMLFYDRLAEALTLARREERGLAVLFLDLDQFKLVNDTLGHAAGDRLLVEIARRLQQWVGESDAVARVGGDEFTLLLHLVEAGDDAVRAARKILAAVARPVEVDGQRLFLTASIGISIYPADGEEPEALLTNADIAMYRAKELGRNRYQLCTPAMNAKSVARLTLERDLRLAVERGELALLYQPQVRTATGRVVGVEALLRWNHPQRGLVGPADFIGIAEETRLILPIGEWVLRTACEQARRWHLDGCSDLRIAVNLSALQFQQRGLVALVQDVLAETDLDPGRLVLEITESAAMHDAALTVEVLSMLRAMGLRVAIDDFGTGHASLSYLRQFPIDALKIDRSFVSDLAARREGSEIIDAIIGLAHGLDLEVIAEGVETEDQLRFLTERGCEEYQGFLISQPLAAFEVPRFLDQVQTAVAAGGAVPRSAGPAPPM
ncbi:MAG TPA: EAL domain-containing protein [Thermoanaerobaculia bacterium]|nr:EAL domain-containing protein [Thermoanaerobaculia bacterium]